MSANCYYCYIPLTPSGLRRLTWDHKIPKSKGGKAGDNIVASCWVCNQEKQSMSEKEFFQVLARRGVVRAQYMLRFFLDEIADKLPVKANTPLNMEDHQMLYEMGISCEGLEHDTKPQSEGRTP